MHRDAAASASIFNKAQATATNPNLIKEYKFQIYSGTQSNADFLPLSVS